MTEMTFHDEAFDEHGEVRAPYGDLLGRLEGADLDALTVRLNDLLAERGVEFGGRTPRPFHVDLLPRVLTGEEWAQIDRGLGQRARALDAFVADVYGEQRALAAGVVPERAVTGSPYFEKEMLAAAPTTGAWVGVAGLDVVRGADGRFFVLEDNARTPSGLAYAMAASDAVAEVLGIERSAETARAEVRAALRGVLEATAPDVEGELVVLTDGPANSAYYEHRELADLAGLELATLDDLRRRGDRLELADGRPVRALYRRTDGDAIRDADGGLTPTAELILEPVLNGTVGMVNRFGTGVADDKFVYSYVDDLVRFYLDEEPAVSSVPTYDLSDPDRCAEVLERAHELVIKPRDGQGGEGVVVGPAATPEELDRARTAIGQDGEAWIAQEVVSLSTVPTVVDGVLSPRHVDLRPFVLNDGRDARVLRGGLTRVAMEEGSMIVNTSQNGGGKATWVG